VATVQQWWLVVTTDSTCGCVVTIGLQCVASGYGYTVVFQQQESAATPHTDRNVTNESE